MTPCVIREIPSAVASTTAHAKGLLHHYDSRGAYGLKAHLLDVELALDVVPNGGVPCRFSTSTSCQTYRHQHQHASAASHSPQRRG